MGTYTVVANADYRNEGWTLAGSGVVDLTTAWNNDDDTKYASVPGTQGRAAVRFPIDISSSNIPDGSVVTSVTVKIRVKKTVSDHKSVTVNVISLENTSRYTSRTLYPTTAFADYEVGTYTVDPVGKAWDKDRLNKMAVQVFSYSVPPNDGVRVAKLYAVINYKKRPNVIVTAPVGSSSSPSPTASWTYTQEDGDVQKSAQFKVFPATTAALASFNPATTTPTATGTVAGDTTSVKLPALAPDNYYLFVQITSPVGAKSIWNSRSFTVSGASPGVPGGGVGGIGTGGGGGFESCIADSETSNAFLSLRDGSNLLGVQQAGFETDTDSLGYTAVNATLARDTNEFFQGVASMSMTSVAGGDMSVLSAFIEVAPTTAMTARLQVKPAASARTCTLYVKFYDDQYTVIGASTASVSASEVLGTYTELVVNATSPTVSTDTLLFAQVSLVVAATGGAAEVHNVDQVGLMYGVNAQWSNGGHASRNVLSSLASDGDDPALTEPWQAGNAASTVDRVASTGTGAEGSKMFRMKYTGVSPTVQYEAVGTVDSQTTFGSGFTLNKPAGTVDGSLLIAYVTSDAGTVTQALAPTGWTVVNSIDTGGVAGSALAVLMRDGLTADPSTWVGNWTTAATRRRSVVVRYSGAAATAVQLLTQGVASAYANSNSTATPVLSNDTVGALRLSAFSVRGNASLAGSMTAATAPPTAPPPIAYVGKAPYWWYGGAQGSYTVNKPSGVRTDDLMLAFATYSGTATPTDLTGWTRIRRVTKTVGNGDDHSGTLTFVVWQRVATGSEPSSWSAAYTGTGTPLLTQCVAYRNVDTSAPILAESFSSAFSRSTSSGTVTNTNSKAWRVTAFGFTTAQGETLQSNDVKERADNHSDVGAHPDVALGVYDSNAPVGTGSHSRTGSTDVDAAYAAIGWIGLLKPTGLIAAPGAETERVDGGTFASSSGLQLAVYDNTADIGDQQVYGLYVPNGASTVSARTAWEGFLLPAAPQVSGEVGADVVTPVDITSVPQAVLDRAAGKVTYQAAFLGSTGGSPLIKGYFYNGNELISTQIAEGRPFGTSVWVKSVATFDVPAGTTRLGFGVTSPDRVLNDYVYWDRASVAFGSGTAWRRGTGQAEHPIYSVPVLEYAEDTGDGYGPWAVLGGSERALLQYDQLTGLTTFVDQMLTPLARRKYRARTISYGLAGDTFVSGYGDESQEISLTAQEWWLKDPTDSTLALQLSVKSGTLDVTTASTAAVFQALGASRPVVLDEGYKGDTFTITVFCDRSEYAALKRMLNSRKTLFLQSNLDNAWWVRPIGDIGSGTLETYLRHEEPIRAVQLTFTEVDPE